MQVQEAMTRNVDLASPDDTLDKIAEIMKKDDIGAMPVGENDRLVGMITDRDIVVKAAAEGKDLNETTVRDAMSGPIFYCFEDEEVDAVADHMGEHKVHRLPVLNRDKRLVGIVSLGDLCQECSSKATSEALKQITKH